MRYWNKGHVEGGQTSLQVKSRLKSCVELQRSIISSYLPVITHEHFDTMTRRITTFSSHVRRHELRSRKSQPLLGRALPMMPLGVSADTTRDKTFLTTLNNGNDFIF